MFGHETSRHRSRRPAGCSTTAGCWPSAAPPAVRHKPSVRHRTRGFEIAPPPHPSHQWPHQRRTRNGTVRIVLHRGVAVCAGMQHTNAASQHCSTAAVQQPPKRAGGSRSASLGGGPDAAFPCAPAAIPTKDSLSAFPCGAAADDGPDFELTVQVGGSASSSAPGRWRCKTVKNHPQSAMSRAILSSHLVNCRLIVASRVVFRW